MFLCFSGKKEDKDLLFPGNYGKILINLNFRKARDIEMNTKRIICLVLVGSIVLGFLGMMAGYLVSLF